MRVRYLGPADRFVAGDREIGVGQQIDLSAEQLALLARPPLGTGIHVFEVSDSQASRVAEASAEAAVVIPPAVEAATEPRPNRKH